MAAAYRSSPGDLFLLKRFRSFRSLTVLVPAIAVIALLLLNASVYDTRWQRTVRAEQRFRLGADSSALHITGPEFLEGLHVTIAGRDTVLEGLNNTYDPALGRGSAVSWLTVKTAQHPVGDAIQQDSLKGIERTVELRGARRPLLVEIRFRSDRPFDLQSAWSTGMRQGAGGKSDRSKTLSWYAFPDSILLVPVTLRLGPTQKVIETIDVTYPDLAAPVTLHRALTTVTTRTIVTGTDTITVQ
jgi:hypothetical protein